MHYHGPTGFAVREAREVVWQENVGAHGKKLPIKYLINETFLGLLIQFFPLGKGHKTHSLASIWCNESWEASPPSMCPDHISTHETCHFFHALPLKLAPTCFIKQCGASRTQEFECKLFLGLPTKMFGIWGLVICGILLAPKLSKMIVAKPKGGPSQLGYYFWVSNG